MTLSVSEYPAMQVPADHFTHDVFLVHTDAPRDVAFVNEYLLANLGLEPERVLRLQTLELGQPISEQIDRGVRSSRVTIVVLSVAAMEDRWVAFCQQLGTYARVADGIRGTLIPLVLEDCELPMHVESLVKLDFRSSASGARDGELARLRTHLQRPGPPAPHQPCPYPGMRPFTRDDGELFFGRKRQLEEILYRLRHGERELYVIGASGSGKSSLLAAGLLPTLARGVEGLPRFLMHAIRPGEYPQEQLAAVLDGDIAAPAAAIHRLLARGAPATTLLLVIDQLEELFTISRDDQRHGFLTLVKALRADPRCVLVFALRGDFYYGAFMHSPLWADNQGRISRIDLGPLDKDDLRQIIERPAHAQGVFLDADLVARLLDDADREPGALPLLQETLLQLWERRHGGRLAVADYQALGDGAQTGLAFAIKRHADFVLGTLTPRQRTIAFRILLRLVSFGEGRADTRRQQPRDALRSTDEATSDFDAVLQCLTDQRLVTVAGDDQRGDVRVDLAHEVLIQAWSAFADRIRAWRAQEQQRRDLETAATSWRASGSGDDGLLGASRLATAVSWQGGSAEELGQTTDLAAFLAASEAAQARARHREAEQREERNRLLVESSQVYQEIGRQRLVEAQRPLEAIPYLVASRQAAEASGGAVCPGLRMLFAQATRNLPTSAPLRHARRIASAGFSRDGTRIVTASDDGTARVWDTTTGTPLSPPFEHHGPVASAALSPDGTRVVTASGDNTARIWDVATGRPITPPLTHRRSVTSAVFSPDGTRAVTASQDGTAQIWDAATGTPLSPPLRHRGHVVSATFSPDGTRVVTASDDKTARVWDAVTGRPLEPPLQHQDRVMSAAFSADGSRVITASEDRTARLWDAVTSRPVAPALEHQNLVWTAAFSTDGTRAVSASADRTAQIWDTAQGHALSPPLQHERDVVSVAFSPDGSRVATASWDHTARIWDAHTGEPLSPPLQHSGRVTSAAFSPDGASIVTASEDRIARIWNVCRPLSVALRHRDFVISAAFSADGARVVTASEDGTAQVWDATTATPLSLALQHDHRVVSAAFSPDGARVVTTSDGTARIWDVATVMASSPPLQHSDRVTSAGFSFDGKRVITGSCDGTARIWDAATGRALSSPLHHQARVNSAVFSRDGTRIATASDDKTARIWDTAVREPVSLALPHQDGVVSTVFSPDGTRVVTASSDGTARVWDVASGRPLSLPLQHHDRVVSAAFCPDGARVVTASDDRTARIWDAVTGQPLSPPLVHQKSVASAAFSPDGSCIVTASWDRTARLWDVASGKPLSPPLRHVGSVTSATFSPDGARILTTADDSAARIWDLPLSSGTLADWRATMERASPYVLAHGVLLSKDWIAD